MADQNKPYGEIPTETPKQEGGENMPIETLTPPPPSSPTVVIPPSAEGAPKWFYLLFGITLIVFFAMTTLLILTLRQRQVGSLKISPSPFPTATSVVEEITPTLTPTKEATDPAILKLTTLATSDDIVDLEADLKNTDLSSIEEIITTLDEQMDFVSPEGE